MAEIAYNVFDKKNLSYTMILDFLKINNTAILPHISEQVNLSEYSNKLSEKAIHFTAFQNKKLVGILSLYFNQFPKFSYVSFICVNKSHRGLYIGDTLMKMAINYCTANGSFSMRLSVGKDNLHAIRFYKKNNFNSVDEGFYPNLDKKYLIMENSINTSNYG